MKMLSLWEYAIVLQPKFDKDGTVIEQGEVLVSPTTILSADEAKATIIASRAIPEERINDLDRVSVVVRPF